MTSSSHERPIGVIVAQLGTPDAPTPSALRRYLKQFLSDPRVIDYPAWLWQPILRGIILVTRPRRSARLYRRIWTEAGSPLLLYSQKQVAGLQERLGETYRVVLGMTYGSPSMAEAMAALEAQGIERVVVLPMFPQYSSTTTASVYDAAFAVAAGSKRHKRFVPALRLVEDYHDHPGYIAAMADHLRETVAALQAAPDHYIVTFHGIPRRYIETGDPYRQQCEATAALLAEALGWRDEEWTVSFQSRFGPEDWLEPYTEEVLTGLAARGIQRPLVFSPGFVTDCLETLDELGHEGAAQFAEGGGAADDYHLAPCLNDNPAWLDVMADITRGAAAGWERTAALPDSAYPERTQPLPYR